MPLPTKYNSERFHEKYSCIVYLLLHRVGSQALDFFTVPAVAYVVTDLDIEQAY